METIFDYMTETEARAERAYGESFRAAYARVYDARHSADRERQLFWTGIAHQAAVRARERVLQAEPAEEAEQAAAA